jgi:hypothetical protein
MDTYAFTCTCGEEFKIDAAGREEAVEKMKNMFDQEAIAKHFIQKHPGGPIPVMEEINVMIASGVKKC